MIALSSDRISVRLPAGVIWHGRGGQGVVTASRLLATAALRAGMYPQSLPEFGAERSGAPLVAYTRIGEAPPILRGPIQDPSFVVVVDESLLGSVDVLAGLQSGGGLIVNTGRPPSEIARWADTPALSVCTVDANGISMALLGRRMPNVPLLGALLRVFPLMGLDRMATVVREELGRTFPSRVVEANLAALKRGFIQAQLVLAEGGVA
ncbi:MAG: 2-oxoacid:acceptor oxidoreductase family protein [Chloroflexi bacterium]|nr:2-oxoacid:acceptor oxidoreductase family protein [Chloroflexota bacterium]